MDNARWLEYSEGDLAGWRKSEVTASFVAFLDLQRLHGLEMIAGCVRRNDPHGAAISFGRVDLIDQLKILIERRDEAAPLQEADTFVDGSIPEDYR